MTQTDFGRAAIDAGLQRITREIETELRSVADAVTRAALADRASAIEAARSAGQADAARNLSVEVARARAEERQAAAGTVARLLEGVRTIEAGQSLTDVLDGLMTALTQAAARVALVVVQGNRVRGWRLVGFGSATQALDLAVSEAGTVGRAVETGETCFAAARPANSPGDDRQWFGPVDASRRGLAVPMLVGGQVAAVAYADGSAEAVGPPRFEPAGVELLVRHAARCLETLTAVRASQAVGVTR